jgi:hypothetical protein
MARPASYPFFYDPYVWYFVNKRTRFSVVAVLFIVHSAINSISINYYSIVPALYYIFKLNSILSRLHASGSGTTVEAEEAYHFSSSEGRPKDLDQFYFYMRQRDTTIDLSLIKTFLEDDEHSCPPDGSAALATADVGGTDSASTIYAKRIARKRKADNDARINDMALEAVADHRARQMIQGYGPSTEFDSPPGFSDHSSGHSLVEESVVKMNNATTQLLQTNVITAKCARITDIMKDPDVYNTFTEDQKKKMSDTLFEMAMNNAH